MRALLSIWPILTFTLSCGQEYAPCTDLCNELVIACGFEAFPTVDSCMQGCEYNADNGADIGAQLLCVDAAVCDTFQILECEHAYGLD